MFYLVCDIIRSQDVPIGIRQTLIPVPTTNEQEQNHCFQHSRGRSGDQYMLMDEEGKVDLIITIKLKTIFVGSQSQDEILYCADTPIDSCGYFEGEDPCDCSVVTYGESDHDEESEDEHADDNFGGKLNPPGKSSSFFFYINFLEWQTSPSIPEIQISTISNNRLDDIDNDDEIEDNQKEMQSLL
jgi:hypothetical protein